VSLIVFLAVYFCALWVSWLLAVCITKPRHFAQSGRHQRKPRLSRGFKVKSPFQRGVRPAQRRQVGRVRLHGFAGPSPGPLVGVQTARDILGFLSFAPPALRHRGLARRRVAVRWRAVLVLAQGLGDVVAPCGVVLRARRGHRLFRLRVKLVGIGLQ